MKAQVPADHFPVLYALFILLNSYLTDEFNTYILFNPAFLLVHFSKSFYTHCKVHSSSACIHTYKLQYILESDSTFLKEQNKYIYCPILRGIPPEKLWQNTHLLENAKIFLKTGDLVGAIYYVDDDD